jgi:hypothetical protein
MGLKREKSVPFKVRGNNGASGSIVQLCDDENLCDVQIQYNVCR